MAFTHKERSGRTVTGARVYVPRRKRLYETGRKATLTKIGERKLVSHRQKGGSTKTRITQTDFANVLDPKTKKIVKAEIKIVSANDANRNFVRQNILTKGAVIETSAGKAKVTNRPGQEGQINAVLIK